MAENIIINGLVLSGVYALLAIGFSLIFGVARIVNLAHTAFYMLAAYLIYSLAVTAGLNLYLSIFLAIVIVVITGMLSYRLVIARIRQHEATTLIVTIALAVILQEALLKGFGGTPRSVPKIISGSTEIFGVAVLNQQILTFGIVLLLLVATWLFLMKTRTGVAIRSTAQDREVANLMGINVPRMEMTTMAISAALAAVAGALVAPLLVLTPGMWTHPLVMVLAIVVLGGLGSLKGSLIGAFILGFAENLVIFLAPSGSYLKTSVALTIMIIVILIRPEGLFGVVFEEERG
ncbi:MAG TPA: branched-chain amino acid ABC transporter permease [Dehalococcoidia bacterium]|nr:branched-chain amino acid ABC transporter permease [Dehalococcoidia bacterium]